MTSRILGATVATVATLTLSAAPATSADAAPASAPKAGSYQTILTVAKAKLQVCATPTIDDVRVFVHLTGKHAAVRSWGTFWETDDDTLGGQWQLEDSLSAAAHHGGGTTTQTAANTSSSRWKFKLRARHHTAKKAVIPTASLPPC